MASFERSSSHQFAAVAQSFGLGRLAALDARSHELLMQPSSVMVETTAHGALSYDASASAGQPMPDRGAYPASAEFLAEMNTIAELVCCWCPSS
jgi:hypothetical protein